MSRVNITIEPSGIATLEFNTPDNLNALDESMAEDFSRAVQTIDPEHVRVIIITGSGRAFSAGGNLEMLEAKTRLSPKENEKRMHEFYRSFLSFLELQIPSIAAINGHAIGAGLCVALACDLRVVAEEAKLGVNFTRLGLHPGMGATWFLPRVVGAARAAELLFTGKIITGSKSAEYGIANSVVPASEVLSAAKSLAIEIAQCGPLATRQLVRCLRTQAGSLQEALDHEAANQAENYGSGEFLEGIRAAKDKRSPSF